MLFNKAVTLTDVHYGRNNNSPVANQDNHDFLDWFIEEAKTWGADICFMLGDWHQNRHSIGISTLHSSMEGVEKLNNAFKKVYWIPGNHDLLYRDRRDVSSISFTKYLSNIEVIRNPITIDGVTILPWLVGDESQKLKNLKSRYVFGHLEINGFLMNAKVPMPTHPNGLMSNSFKGPEYVFSGHFHFRQAKDNVVYTGNIMPFDFADVWDEERGMMFLEWGKEPFFKAWPDQPLFRTMNLSQLLNEPEKLLRPKTTARVSLDLDISFEEAQIIKEEYTTKFGARKIELIPMIKNNVGQAALETTVFQTVDQMVVDGINEAELVSLESQTLLNIYESL